MSAERIQKLLARAGIASRRKAEELIRDGRVTVDGKVAELGERADPESQSIKLDGKRLEWPRQHRYLLLNKPKGYLTAVSDERGRPTVLDLVPPAWRSALFPVGRLDFHTEGLLLLTTDGEFAQRVAHPRYGCRKLYEAKVKGVPEESAIARIRRGMVIDGRRTLPAVVERLRLTARGEGEGNSWWQVELAEGRSRQIREMFFRIGHPVQKLKRVAIGSLKDPDLPLGALREVSEAERARLLRPRRAAVRPGVRRDAGLPVAAARRAQSGSEGRGPRPDARRDASRRPRPRG